MDKPNKSTETNQRYYSEWSANDLIAILSKRESVKASIHDLIKNECSNWHTKPEPYICNVKTDYRNINSDFLYSYSESMLSDNGIIRIPDIIVTDNNNHTLHISTDWNAETVGYLDDNLLFVCTPYPSYKKPARLNIQCLPSFTFTEQPQKRRLAELGGIFSLEDEIAPITLTVRHNPVKFIDKYRDALERKGFDMTVVHIIEGSLIRDEENCDVR